MKKAWFEIVDPVPYPQNSFVVQINDKATIEHARGVIDGTVPDNMWLTGVIQDKPASFNAGWSFHLDPSTIGFAFTTIEAIQGTISYVAHNVDYWVDALAGQWATSAKLTYELKARFGGASDDVMKGTAGTDLIVGKGGDDTLFGRDGHDVMNGAGGADVVNGGEGGDRLAGGGGADHLLGGTGDDALFGDAGADSMGGGAGNDWLVSRFDGDTVNGGRERTCSRRT